MRNRIASDGYAEKERKQSMILGIMQEMEI